jgi:hypothetical protein
VFLFYSNLPCPSRQLRSRRGARACAARERAERRTLVACPVPAVAPLSGISGACAAPLSVEIVFSVSRTSGRHPKGRPIAWSTSSA